MWKIKFIISFRNMFCIHVGAHFILCLLFLVRIYFCTQLYLENFLEKENRKEKEKKQT